MKRIIIAAGTAAILGAGPTFAAEPEIGVRLGTTVPEIAAALRTQGYEIVKHERKRREIEVYADRDGRRWELKIDPLTGTLLRIEEED